MKTYTREDWHNDGVLNVQIGQIVDDDIIEQLADCVPPRYYSRGLFQPGEPASHEVWEEDPRFVIALYDTYERAEEGWRYLGMQRGK